MERRSRYTPVAFAPPVVVLLGIVAGCADPDVNQVKVPIESVISSPVDNTHFFEGQPVELVAVVSSAALETRDKLDEVSVTINLDGKTVGTTAPDEAGRVTAVIPTLGLKVGEVHTLQVMATHPDSAEPEPDAVPFVVDTNMAPEAAFVQPSSSQRLYAGTPVTVGVRVYDEESRYDALAARILLDDAPVEDAVALSAGADSHEGLGSTHLTFAEGQGQVLRLEVTDAYQKQVAEELVINVGPANRAPGSCAIVAPLPTDELFAGKALTLKGSVADEDQPEDELVYSWSDGQTTLGSGHPTTGGDISFTLESGLSVGSHSLTLTVMDEVGASCTVKQTVEVKPPDEPPVVQISYPSSDLSEGAVQNEERTFYILAEARDKEDTSALPLWLTINAQTAPLSGASCTLNGQSQTSQGIHVSSYQCSFAASSLPVGEPVTLYAHTQDGKAQHGVDWVILQVTPCVDSDGDGYNSCQEAGCDNNPTVNPGKREVCDGIDNDCDKVIDSNAVDRKTFYRDADGDRFGNCGDTALSCSPPQGYVAVCGDCNDTAIAVNPSVAEVCGDTLDNDCDGQADEGFDQDGDGQRSCQGDCDDSDPLIKQGASERCNGLDDNCDGVVPQSEKDGDGDGYVYCEEPSCDDDAAIHPNAPELCDEKDNNCDGVIPQDELEDRDGDGWVNCRDGACADDASRNPGVPEKCNGVDDDCDGLVDDGFDQDGDSFFTCAVGVKAADCNDADKTVYPGASEVCDGVDANCDTVVDTDPHFDADQDGVASCLGDCDDQDAAVSEKALEVFDGKDNDCNGELDDLLVEREAGTSWQGEAYHAFAGSSVAGLGDVNGDAIPDYLIGVPRGGPCKADVTGLTGQGCAWFVPGGSQELGRQVLSAAPAFFAGVRADDEAGGSVAAAGDLNGDGYQDFVVGARLARGSDNGAPALSGAAYVFFGCKAGSTLSNGKPCLSGQLSPQVTLVGEAQEDHAGTVVAPAGDLNCDGLDDLVVSAPEHDEGDTADAGRVYVLFGRSTGWQSTLSLGAADVIIRGENQGDRLGAAMPSLPGDLGGGESCHDLVVQAPTADGASRVYIFYGQSQWDKTLSAGSASVILFGDEGESTGAALALADLNHDGLDDLAIGAPDAAHWEGATMVASAGRVHLFYARDSWISRLEMGEADVVIEGELQPEQAGFSLSGGLDLNGDLVDDLVVGAPGWSTTVVPSLTWRGRAYVFYGSSLLDGDLIGTGDAGASFAGGTPDQDDPTKDAMNLDRVGTRVGLVGDLSLAFDPSGARGAAAPGSVLVASPYYDYGTNDVGKVYVVRGKAVNP